MVGLIGGRLDDGHGPVLVGQSGSQGLDHFFSFFSVLGVGLFIGNDVLEVDFAADHVSGGHHVVQVHVLDEGLHSGAFHDFFLSHFLGDLAGVSLKTGHQSVGELSLLRLWNYLGSFL